MTVLMKRKAAAVGKALNFWNAFVFFAIKLQINAISFVALYTLCCLAAPTSIIGYNDVDRLCGI